MWCYSRPPHRRHIEHIAGVVAPMCMITGHPDSYRGTRSPMWLCGGKSRANSRIIWCIISVSNLYDRIAQLKGYDQYIAGPFSLWNIWWRDHLFFFRPRQWSVPPPPLLSYQLRCLHPRTIYPNVMPPVDCFMEFLASPLGILLEKPCS